MLGWLMDRGQVQAVFFTAAAALLAAVGCAALVGQGVLAQRERERGGAAAKMAG